jgi:hypothetical protein
MISAPSPPCLVSSPEKQKPHDSLYSAEGIVQGMKSSLQNKK